MLEFVDTHSHTVQCILHVIIHTVKLAYNMTETQTIINIPINSNKILSFFQLSGTLRADSQNIRIPVVIYPECFQGTGAMIIIGMYF